MGMPNHLVLVRHGESESNLAQRLERDGRGDEVPPEFYERHDWQHRLSSAGVLQAQQVGGWILKNIGDIDTYFDGRYVSPFIRPRETAQHLGNIGTKWLIDNRLIERNWGTYGAVPLDSRAVLFPYTEIQRAQSSLYAQHDNGESIGYNTIFRVRDWLGTLHRDMSERAVIAVTHGEFMWSVRYVLEGMLPEEWDMNDDDKSQQIRNCTVLEYTRIDPYNPTADPDPWGLRWMRMTYPNDIAASPFGGEWQEISGKRYMSGDDLHYSVQAVQPVFA